MYRFRIPAVLAALVGGAAPASAQSALPDWDFWAQEKLVAVDPDHQAAAE